MISIILPTYNSAHTVPQAIRSVLAQSHTDWELLVIDDGSADDTERTVKAFTDPRIMYIKQEQNLGLQKTLNHGLRLAKGQYIARIDADDVWSDASKLQTQLLFLEQNPEHVLVGTRVIAIDTEGREVNRYVFPKTDKAIRNRILSRNCFAHSSVLFKKGAYKYAESLDTLHAEDYDLWLRLGLEGKFANIPAFMATLTLAPTTITARNRIIQAKRILVIVWKYKSKYPNALFGVAAATSRYIFFCIANVIPIPQWLVRWMHRFSKSV